MIPRLVPLFCGPLLPYADKLQLTAAGLGALPAGYFFREAQLGEFMDRLQDHHQARDRRALVSIWSKWYFTSFLAPVLAANLLLDRGLPLRLGDVRIRLDDNGKPQGLTMADDGHSVKDVLGFERFADLIEGHLQPVIEVLAVVSKASPRLFWSNAGNTFEFATTRVELHPLFRQHATAPAHQVLSSRLRPDGQRNPLFAPVSYRDIGEEEPQRLRRICCIRYRLPGVGYCSSCPIDVSKRHS